MGGLSERMRRGSDGIGCLGPVCPGSDDPAKPFQNTSTVDSLRREGHIEALDLNPSYSISKIDLHGQNAMVDNLNAYFRMCKDSVDLVVVTSCFTIWRQSGRTNIAGKVVPAIPVDYEPTRVFFFDDNANLKEGGTASGVGICNLRDVQTADFVDFSEGVNGFSRDLAFDQTIIHHSSSYRNVVVSASILDAIANPDYFTRIIERYAHPDEQIVIVSDVNSTILMEDTLEGKKSSEVLLSTMFMLAEVQPRGNIVFDWDTTPSIHVKKRMSLKQLVRDVCGMDTNMYHSFWSHLSCKRFLAHVMSMMEVIWTPTGEVLSQDRFWSMFDNYDAELLKYPTIDGIASSWFEMVKFIRGKGRVVLNSFGIDTRKVVDKTVPEATRVEQLVVNYEMWNNKDIVSFNALFQDELQRP